MIADSTLWIVIIALGLGSYLLRISFLVFVGGRPMPEWLLRHLRYTAVAILPALIAPLVVYAGEDGGVDPARILAALLTVAVGYFTRNTLLAIVVGAMALFGGIYLFG
ncbi:MAG: AzlD domain-containing protein [Rhodobacteraceae bacterium]|nr:AzlD domain-containing protein [Paracoccaceae bacterium]